MDMGRAKCYVLLFLVIMALVFSASGVLAAKKKLNWVMPAGTVEAVNLYKEMAKMFEDKHPDVKIEYISVPWAEFDKKVDVLIAGGDPPAIWYPAAKRGYRYYAAKGMLMDIEPFLSRDRFPLDDYFDAALNFVRWKGRLRGLPVADYYPMLMYNKDLFKEAGLEPPPNDLLDPTWLWEGRFLEAAKKLTKDKDGDGRIDQFGVGAAYDYRVASWVFGGDWFPREDYISGIPTKSTINSPEVVKGLQFLSDLVNKSHVQPSPMEMEAVRAGAVDPFASGRVGMSYTSTWALAWLKDVKHFSWGIGAVPRYKVEQKPKLTLYPDQWIMFANQKYPQEAWEFFKFINSPEAIKMHWNARGRPIIPRHSMVNLWADHARSDCGLSDKEVKMIIDEQKYVNVVPSHAIIPFAEIYDTIIAPELDALWLGKKTAQEVVNAVHPRLIRYLKEKGYAK